MQAWATGCEPDLHLSKLAVDFVCGSILCNAALLDMHFPSAMLGQAYHVENNCTQISNKEIDHFHVAHGYPSKTTP